MKIITVVSNDIKMVRENNRFSVYSNEQKVVSYPLSYFDGIFCFSNVSITTPLIKFLSSNGKYIAFFSQTGKLNSIIFPLEKQSSVSNRIKQFSVYSCEEESLKFCKLLIESKIEEIQNYFGIDISNYKKKIWLADKKDSILGIEGTVSSLMFKSFKEKMQAIGLDFKGRDYFPPTDEINSILSFVYSYFYNIVTALLYFKGFDPYIGILHSKKGLHYAFSSDCIEVIRPFLTFSVIEMLSKIDYKTIKFIKKENAVFIDIQYSKDIISWLNDNCIDHSIKKVTNFLTKALNSD